MKYLLSVVIAIFLSFCCVGCGKKVENYGDIPEENAQKTPISAILLSPNQYKDKEVVIEGVITNECPTGGFIYVDDQAGHVLYVEMHGAEFAPIPQRGGHPVVVKGIVFQGEDARKEVKLLGKGVIIR